jgi:molybdopterin synthase catalytic subunit
MRIRLRLFGAAREAVGAKDLELSLANGASVAELRALLLREFPGLAPLDARVRVSVNHEFAQGDFALSEGDEVALLPPVAGGDGGCTISGSPLDVGAVVRRVTGPEVGGIVTFVGTVRDHARGRSIRYLEYEAYPEMAEREMQRIAEEAATRFPGARVAMAHRTGHLAIGEIAVVVAAAAPHRAEAFSACRFAIDALKERVPIWKKEIASDGAYWVDDHA